MKKSELRKIFKQKRNQLSAAQIADQSQAIARLFFDTFNLSQSHVIHTYLPISQQNEVDTIPIIDGIEENFPSTKIIISRSVVESNELENFIWSTSTPLTINSWGILEPNSHTHTFYKLFDFDIVFIPLLVYDIHGNRIGYGKGFYDRFLAKCPTKTTKIGLSFFEPIDLITDTNSYDRPLDFCITPHKIWKF